jgi:hypothetical protein
VDTGKLYSVASNRGFEGSFVGSGPHARGIAGTRSEGCCVFGRLSINRAQNPVMRSWQPRFSPRIFAQRLGSSRRWAVASMLTRGKHTPESSPQGRPLTRHMRLGPLSSSAGDSRWSLYSMGSSLGITEMGVESSCVWEICFVLVSFTLSLVVSEALPFFIVPWKPARLQMART